MYEICTLLSSFGQKMYGPKVLNIGPFRCTTYVEPDQIIFERFLTNLKLWWIRLTDQSYLRIMMKVRYLDHPYSIYNASTHSDEQQIHLMTLPAKTHTLSCESDAKSAR